MTPREVSVSVPGGEIATVDYGGHGRDLLLFHTVGSNAAVWSELGPVLAEVAHVVAFDMRGHGQSTCELDHVQQLVDDFPYLVGGLGLSRPVLVGHQYGGGVAAAGAAARPDIPAALCLIDSPAVLPQQAYRELMQLVSSSGVAAELATRFGLGVTGNDAIDLEWFVTESTERLAGDWLFYTKSRNVIERYVRRGTLQRADGSWIRRPTPDTNARITALPDDFEYYPGIELLADVPFPVWGIQPRDGDYVEGFGPFEAAARNRAGWAAKRTRGGSYFAHANPPLFRDLLVPLMGRLPTH